MSNEEVYTLVNTTSGKHYDTYDEMFYDSNWDVTGDKIEYLQRLIDINPCKFIGYQIINTKNQKL